MTARTTRAETVERTVAAFAVFMSRIASNHVPTFTEMELTMAQAKAIYLIAARGSILMSDLAARLGSAGHGRSAVLGHAITI